MRVFLYSSLPGEKGGKRLPQMLWLRLRVSQGGCQSIVLYITTNSFWILPKILLGEAEASVCARVLLQQHLSSPRRGRASSRAALLTGELFWVLLKVLSRWGAGQALNSAGTSTVSVCVTSAGASRESWWGSCRAGIRTQQFPSCLFIQASPGLFQ